ncbi:hypothetical protein DNTS_024274 [Danionella cerebrum]|uniref:Uncharacterized protein n=1 Tax=Danionella cerebrum TaxID=2873325 RepID=A0A553R3C4_9TELE|nr:hypothetical protein DNTS_024274 [Danionella translucida]TRY96667.1 hypothetical protein DNTS_024274 [Danionella translucida]
MKQGEIERTMSFHSAGNAAVNFTPAEEKTRPLVHHPCTMTRRTSDTLQRPAAIFLQYTAKKRQQLQQQHRERKAATCSSSDDVINAASFDLAGVRIPRLPSKLSSYECCNPVKSSRTVTYSEADCREREREREGERERPQRYINSDAELCRRCCCSITLPSDEVSLERRVAILYLRYCSAASFKLSDAVQQISPAFLLELSLNDRGRCSELQKHVLTCTHTDLSGGSSGFWSSTTEITAVLADWGRRLQLNCVELGYSNDVCFPGTFADVLNITGKPVTTVRRSVIYTALFAKLKPNCAQQ